jgi:hypothetical protein
LMVSPAASENFGKAAPIAATALERRNVRREKLRLKAIQSTIPSLSFLST